MTSNPVRDPSGQAPAVHAKLSAAGAGERGDTVLAFGGVVWERPDAQGEARVVVVHRPRYDDWSFPKGKAEPGEAPEGTAVREVEEETGLTCRVGASLGQVSYPLADGRMKVVGFWAMAVTGRRPRPADDEVDAVAWWTVEQAERRLTHAQDIEILHRFLEARRS